MIEKQLENGETPKDLLRLQAELDVVRRDRAEYIRKLENAQMETLLRRCKSYNLEAAIRTIRSAIEGVTRAR